LLGAAGATLLWVLFGRRNKN